MIFPIVVDSWQYWVKPLQQPTYSITNHFHIDNTYFIVYAGIWFAEIGCILCSLGLHLQFTVLDRIMELKVVFSSILIEDFTIY